MHSMRNISQRTDGFRTRAQGLFGRARLPGAAARVLWEGARRGMLCAALAVAAASGLAGQGARADPGQALPPERATYKKSELPGYQRVLGDCLTCHSAEYVLTQPPTSSRAYWDATVKKMKKPFGAPFPDDDIPAIVDYLTKTYGAEQPPAGPSPAGRFVPAR